MITLHNIFVYITDIVGERGKQQAVFPETPEHGAELAEVFTQEYVRLTLRHRPCRVPFARQKPVPVADVGMVLFRVPALEVFRTAHRPFKERQTVNFRIPRHLVAVVLRRHGADCEKRT